MNRSLCLLAVLAASTPAGARAQQPPPPPPAEPRDGAPRVHLEARDPSITLYKVNTRMMRRGRSAGVIAGPVCRAPCDQLVDAPAGQSFFFGGEGLSTSSQFQLFGKGADVRIEVLSVSASRRTGGFVMAGLGAAALLGGLATLALGALSTTIRNGSTTGAPSTPLMAAGGGIAAGGLGLLIGGITLVTTSKTTYSFLQAGTSTPLLTF